MAAPLVTVLVPVKDTNEIWLRTAIRTIAQQSYENLEVVVCDDGSTNASTVDILKESRERWPDRVRLVRNGSDKHGTAYALDVALAVADPKTVYFSKLDSDDFAHRDRERNRVKLFETLPPQIGGLYDNFLMLNYRPRPHIQPVILHPYDYRQHVNESYIHGNSMWRASVFDAGVPRTFLYDGYEGKANKHGEDYNFWLQIGDKFDFFWMNNDPAFSWVYRFTGDQRSKYASDKKGVDYARALLQQRARERRGLT